jgi:hypothetical protein
MVLAARDKDGTVAREAIARLCSTYWYPLYAFIRRQGVRPREAEDLTREFFFRFLETKPAWRRRVEVPQAANRQLPDRHLFFRRGWSAPGRMWPFKAKRGTRSASLALRMSPKHVSSPADL